MRNKRVNDILRRAINKGIIKKPKECQKCNREEELKGFHPDLRKPLAVIFVCQKCLVCLETQKNIDMGIFKTGNDDRRNISKALFHKGKDKRRNTIRDSLGRFC